MKAKVLTMIAVLAVLMAGAFVAVDASVDEDDFTAEYVVSEKLELEKVRATFSQGLSKETSWFATVSDSNGEVVVDAKIVNAAKNPAVFAWNKIPLSNGTYTVTIFDSAQTVEYIGHFTIGETPVEPKIVEIEAEAAETTYYVGQKFDASKMTVTATYDDGNKAVLTADAYTYAPAGELALTDTQITVTLKDDETITDAIEISVKEKVVTTTVTFVISEGYTKVVTTVVGQPADKPADPVVEGVDFIGWFTEAGEQFDFATAIQGETTLIAHFGPKALPPTQTEKFVASVTKDCTIVITAYDEKIIGKATAKVQLYKETDVGGTMMYVAVKDAVVPVDIDSENVFFVKNVANDVKGLITEPGNYAVMAQISLNGITQTTNYVTIDDSEQA